MNNLLILEAVQDYIHYITVVDQKALATIHSYEHDLKVYTTYLMMQHIEAMEEITYQNIQDFLSCLSQEKQQTKIMHGEICPRKASSINHMITSIHMFHRYITMTYPAIIDPSIHIRGKKTRQKLPLYFNIEDITKLLDSFTDSKDDIFHKAILELLYGCGLRVSEVCSLTLNQVHLEQGFLRVIGKGDKERMIPMHHRCIVAVLNYIEFVREDIMKVHAQSLAKGDAYKVRTSKKAGYLFINQHGNSLTRQYVHTLIKKKLKELHLDEHLSAHSFRHSFASHVLDGGADLRVVQELLGHCDITTTQVYTHIQNKRLYNAYRSFHPRSTQEVDSNHVIEAKKKAGNEN